MTAFAHGVNINKINNYYDLICSTDDLFGERTATDRPEPIYTDKKGKKRYFTDAIGGYHGTGNSFKKRSAFWPSIAAAMADQWG